MKLSQKKPKISKSFYWRTFSLSCNFFAFSLVTGCSSIQKISIIELRISIHNELVLKLKSASIAKVVLKNQVTHVWINYIFWGKLNFLEIFCYHGNNFSIQNHIKQRGRYIFSFHSKTIGK